MSEVHFIYDGECPICKYAAHAFQIKRAVGRVAIINAREEKDHPLVLEVNKRAINLDEGMIIVYEGNFYHGKEALHLMGMIGSDIGWFNKVNACLFKSKPVAQACYPFLRGIRNALLKIKGVGKINNLN